MDIDERKIAEIAERFEISELALFGSILRDDFSPRSDVDLLVDFAPTAHHSYFDLMVIRTAFENFFGRHVDMVEKAGIKNPFRKQSILSSARVVYAAH